MTTLTAISPIDGRYRNKVADLENYFSEFALMKYRTHVEIEYFIYLSNVIEQIGALSATQIQSLRTIVKDFSTEHALRIKEIEKTTNHDVKAVEYFIKENIKDEDLKQKSEFIHFGLTSQDINNTSIPLMLKDFYHQVYVNKFKQLVDALTQKVQDYNAIPLLARTHGQPASPTKLGKELQVFVERLTLQSNYFSTIPYSSKFGGATGNFNAHLVAFPAIDWKSEANNFVENSLGLVRSQTTTQIEHYDNMAALFHNYSRINTILIDLCRDIWTYISMDYFKQKIKAGEVGSSAMPHKVNPIDFENAEGNLGIANALFYHLAEKLPISRLQRDLTDSTVFRNVGVPLAHTLIAIDSILKGLDKLLVNEDKIRKDLEDNWIVVAEAIQTILRREGYEQPYEKLRDLTRTNAKIDDKVIHQFIDSLDVSELIKIELKQITPFNYTGI
ncbi:MAG TPA: adenylosuccinate lyase [Chitinophagales bacterium]|nr:adenylosuccinate lyase [Chitinophagales bacterium]HMU97258.1 adenylosuccinate lyase [Chitinophagales bacterium]HMV02839.1 adenylosuccinate lyase [Chitinophagales bacterium]HMW93776.1 adenylosuccinate lyase [Chitinophagales bacterium]HMY42359.1 adenylosuccinate lyase [Chitinophagales bacterium]